MENYVVGLKELKTSTDDYFKLIAERSKLTRTKIKNFVKKAPENDWFFDTEAAQTHGIVTAIGLPVVPAVDEEDGTFEFMMSDEERSDSENELDKVAAQ